MLHSSRITHASGPFCNDTQMYFLGRLGDKLRNEKRLPCGRSANETSVIEIAVYCPNISIALQNEAKSGSLLSWISLISMLIDAFLPAVETSPTENDS